VTKTVLVDTNVFTARLREGSPLAVAYAKHVFGYRVAIARQTVAEARYGALKAAWGPRRLGELAKATDLVRILPVDLETVETVADLRNQCRLVGHALHQRAHNADLRIAATAIHWGISALITCRV
jgi:predicted nucleic acid-binding protein